MSTRHQWISEETENHLLICFIWAYPAAYIWLHWLDNHGQGIPMPQRSIVYGFAVMFFAIYGFGINYWFVFPALKELCHHLAPSDFKAAILPRVKHAFEQYWEEKITLKTLVYDLLVQANRTERLVALEYMCLVGLPVEAINAALPPCVNDDVVNNIYDVYNHPARRKVFAITALITVVSLFALLANFTLAKTFLAGPALAGLRVLIGDKWFK